MGSKLNRSKPKRSDLKANLRRAEKRQADKRGTEAKLPWTVLIASTGNAIRSSDKWLLALAGSTSCCRPMSGRQGLITLPWSRPLRHHTERTGPFFEFSG